MVRSLPVMVMLSFQGTVLVLSNIRESLRLYFQWPSWETSSRNDLGPNQVCTLFGTQSGSDIISRHDYLLAGYGTDTADLWRHNFLVIVGFFLLFQLTQFLALKFHPVSVLLSISITLAWRLLQQYGHIISVNIYAKENADAKKRNEVLRQKKEERQRRKEEGLEREETEQTCEILTLWLDQVLNLNVIGWSDPQKHSLGKD